MNQPMQQTNRAGIVAVVVAGLAVIGGLTALLVMSGGDDNGSEGATTVTSTTSSTTVATTTTTAPATSTSGPDEVDPSGPVGPETDDIARAAVLLVQLDGAGNPACFSGSGSILTPEGEILTNAHVVANDPVCPYEQLGVAVVEATDEPPRLAYLADIVAYDDALDLAVVTIASDLDGLPVDDLVLPYVAVGDSEAVDLGDSLRILGFPGIGGNTITFTLGAVSGFVSQRGIDETRAWIKTDATIAGGNSGGLAVDDDGRLVGVPTTAGAGDESALTDCRLIEDTNGDGFIDGSDSCVPIGGFINGLRPVNLALDLIARAEQGEIVELPAPNIDAPPDFDPADVVIESVYFATDVDDDNQPVDIVSSLPSGRDRLCAIWTYDGMSDGVGYDAIWRVDGEIDETGSYLGDIWSGGVSGEWWVCILNDEVIPDGLYEFEFSAAGEFLASESIYVGGDREPVTFEVVNASDQTICYVQISPTLASYWGPDDLGSTEVIDPGVTRAFDLVTGDYDILMHDCDLEPLYEQLEMAVTGDQVLTFEG